MPPRLFIFDVDGVLRDSSEAALEGMRIRFRNEGVEIAYDHKQYRLIRSAGKYNNSERCLELMLALQREDVRPEHVVSRSGPSAERVFDQMVASISTKRTPM